MQAVVIGIAGGSGSGKTTLAQAVAADVAGRTCSLAFDSYYRDQQDLTTEQRGRTNYDHPNSLDVERFAEDLSVLKSGRSIAAPVYDFAAHTRSSDIQLVDSAPTILVDGILLFVFDEICDLIDLKVFVDVSDDVRTERRVARDIADRGRTREFALAQIERTVRPMYGEFVGPSRDQADLVIDGTYNPASSAGMVLDALRAPLTVS